MKVVFNTLPLHAQSLHRGIGVYTRLLREALQTYDPENSYVLARDRGDLASADLIHYPYFDFFFLTLPLIKKKPSVVTIHDVIPLLFPDEYKRGIKGALKLAIQQLSVKGALKIVTDSDASKIDIVKHLGLSEQRVERVYLAADDGYGPATQAEIDRVLATHHLTQPYFLYVGDINYNKNVSGLIKSFLNTECPQRLVLVSKALGQDIPEARQIRDLIEHSHKRDSIRVLSSVDTASITELKALYSGADWYIQPSFYEGFGLPVVEAMKCESAVISSLGGSLGELVDHDRAIVFDPADANGLTQALSRALTIQKKEKKALITTALSYMEKFQWEITARHMVRIYRQCLETK